MMRTGCITTSMMKAFVAWSIASTLAAAPSGTVRRATTLSGLAGTNVKEDQRDRLPRVALGGARAVAGRAAKASGHLP